MVIAGIFAFTVKDHIQRCARQFRLKGGGGFKKSDPLFFHQLFFKANLFNSTYYKDNVQEATNN